MIYNINIYTKIYEIYKIYKIYKIQKYTKKTNIYIYIIQNIQNMQNTNYGNSICNKVKKLFLKLFAFWIIQNNMLKRGVVYLVCVVQKSLFGMRLSDYVSFLYT